MRCRGPEVGRQFADLPIPRHVALCLPYHRAATRAEDPVPRSLCDSRGLPPEGPPWCGGEVISTAVGGTRARASVHSFQDSFRVHKRAIVIPHSSGLSTVYPQRHAQFDLVAPSRPAPQRCASPGPRRRPAGSRRPASGPRTRLSTRAARTKRPYRS